MNNESVRKFGLLLNRYSLSMQSAISLIVDNGSFESYKRAEVIFSEKRYNAFEYFQIEGIAHRFNTDPESQVVTTGIFFDSAVITPHFARTLNSQSIFSLQALTDCVYLKVPVGAFDELRATNEHIRAFGQKVVEREFIRNLNFEVLFRSYSAKDRLLYFRATFPQLENLVPHTVIASFLGITPVSFSRLRNELAKK